MKKGSHWDWVFLFVLVCAAVVAFTITCRSQAQLVHPRQPQVLPAWPSPGAYQYGWMRVPVRQPGQWWIGPRRMWWPGRNLIWGSHRWYWQPTGPPERLPGYGQQR